MPLLPEMCSKMNNKRVRAQPIKVKQAAKIVPLKFIGTALKTKATKISLLSYLLFL